MRRGRRLLRKAAKPALVILSLVILGPPVGVYAFLLFGRRPKCKPPARRRRVGRVARVAEQVPSPIFLDAMSLTEAKQCAEKNRHLLDAGGESSAKAVTSIQSPRVHPTHSRRLRLLEG